MFVALEVFQWAVILFLGVMVFGLTRQLGFFIVPRHEQLKQQGPQPGARLPTSLVPEAQQAQLAEEILLRPAAGGAVLVIDENCLGCRELVEDLTKFSALPRHVALGVVVKHAGPAFVEEVRAVCDVLVDDRTGDMSREAGIVGTPSVLLVDDHLQIEEAEVGGLVASVARTWFGVAELEVIPAASEHAPTHQLNDTTNGVLS